MKLMFNFSFYKFYSFKFRKICTNLLNESNIGFAFYFPENGPFFKRQLVRDKEGANINPELQLENV